LGVLWLEPTTLMFSYPEINTLENAALTFVGKSTEPWNVDNVRTNVVEGLERCDQRDSFRNPPGSPL
jgi:hypothetical protein